MMSVLIFRGWLLASRVCYLVLFLSVVFLACFWASGLTNPISAGVLYMDDTMIPHGNKEKYGANGIIEATTTYTAEFLGDYGF